MGHSARVLAFITMGLASLLGVKAGAEAAPGPDPILSFPPEMMTPELYYPDRQPLRDFSGTMTIVYTAQGGYTFSNGPLDREDVRLAITFTQRYDRGAHGESITGTVAGARHVDHTIRSPGKNGKTRKERRVEPYSGTATMQTTFPSVIRSLVFSKKMGMVAFEVRPSRTVQGWTDPFIMTNHQEEDVVDGDRHDHESWEHPEPLSAGVPSHGSDKTVWGSWANGKRSLAIYGWLEGPSTKGETSGGFSMPAFYHDGSWLGPDDLKAAGVDPEAKPSGPDDVWYKGSVQVSWSFGQAGTPPGKMTIEPLDDVAYPKWTPSPVTDEARFGPASKVSFWAKILPREPGTEAPRGKIHFWLRDASRQSGTCGNFPPEKPEGGDDLRFSASQAEGIVLDPADPRHAYTKEIQFQASVSVEALDTGAHGALQATCDDLGLIAEDVRTGLRTIRIPMDDNDNHVADAWEAEKGAVDLPEDWDDESVPGQDQKGDGLTLYDEYRGLLVLEGGKEAFKRLEPQQKELFVIDTDGSFDPATWLSVSGIRAWRVDETQTRRSPKGDSAPMVNYLSDAAADQRAYAVKLETVAGDQDPSPGAGQTATTADPGVPRMAYTLTSGTPKGTEYAKVFPARARLLVDFVAGWIEKGLSDPSSPAWTQLRDDPANGFTLGDAQKAAGMLRDGAVKAATVKKMVTALVLHEVGHCCGGLVDHLGAPPAGREDAGRSCIMFNPGDYGRRRMVIKTVLERAAQPLAYPYTSICRELGEGFACFEKLTVKD